MNIKHLQLSSHEYNEVMKMKKYFEQSKYLHIYALNEEIEAIWKYNKRWYFGRIKKLNANAFCY